jgi:integrase
VTTALRLLPLAEPGRVGRDRLEILTALINAPSFDPLYRGELIEFPRHHPAYNWGCHVDGCEKPVNGSGNLCTLHFRGWSAARVAGMSWVEFIAQATPLALRRGAEPGECRICPGRPAGVADISLCKRHRHLWTATVRRHGPAADFTSWLAGQHPLPAYGTCRSAVCPRLAGDPVGLCAFHASRYYHEGRPGGARLPAGWARASRSTSRPAAVHYDDEGLFRRWCATSDAAHRVDALSLAGLRPLVKAEIKWGLHVHAQQAQRSTWQLMWLRRLIRECRLRDVQCLTDLDLSTTYRAIGMISNEIQRELRLVYCTRADTKAAGFLETDHFGRRFRGTLSHIDLTGIAQRWLRDQLWDHMADHLEGPHCPRSRGPFDAMRRACLELGAFLALDAPHGGHDPTLLTAEHAQRFGADQRHRAQHQLPSIALSNSQSNRPAVVSDSTTRIVFMALRRMFHTMLTSGSTDRVGLDRSFVTALPRPGREIKTSRNPFTDDVAQALADERNLDRFAEIHDAADSGLCDIWVALVYTGRRCQEIIGLRLDCLGRYGSLPMLWHDQTKVGNYNESIRIPEALYLRLDQRRAKTLQRFQNRHGRPPTAAERAAMAMFPSTVRNPTLTRSLSYGHFNHHFRGWVNGLDLGEHPVPHQARHTLATGLLRHGATLTHIRRYLGQVSDRMAEHYTKVAVSEIEDVLQAVWVAGPAAASPGALLSGATPMDRHTALALALDLSRRSTPADGGFCTFQPVVQGGACPWNLDCHNCDKFVMSGADLLYWRRKQEQWRSLAERAPDDATAGYLHQVFEPTARAITGLETALAGLGLLDDALALDLRRPQDYFHRVWSTAFRAGDLAAHTNAEPTRTQP